MYNLDPKTRKEHLMGKISGNPNAEEITDLRTREEYFLKDIEEASGGGSGGSGYTVTEEQVVVIPEQTVTTNKKYFNGYYAALTVADGATVPDSMAVTYNGVKYNLVKKIYADTGMNYFGATITGSDADWSELPFFISFYEINDEITSRVVIETKATTITVKAEAVTKAVEVSEDFQKARGYWAESASGEIVPYQEITTWESNNAPAGYMASLHNVADTEYPDTMTALFNGTEYELAKKTIGAVTYYGATVTVEGASATADWSEYPFIVMFNAGESALMVESNSPATIECIANAEGVAVSDDFKRAVESVVGAQEDIYDLELVYRESQGDYSARIPGDGLPYDNMMALLDSHKAFYFYIPTSGDGNMGLRVFVDSINRNLAGVNMSGGFIKNGTLSVYSGSMNSRNTSLFITKTDYTLTPAT